MVVEVRDGHRLFAAARQAGDAHVRGDIGRRGVEHDGDVQRLEEAAGDPYPSLALVIKQGGLSDGDVDGVAVVVERVERRGSRIAAVDRDVRGLILGLNGNTGAGIEEEANLLAQRVVVAEGITETVTVAKMGDDDLLIGEPGVLDRNFLVAGPVELCLGDV